MAWIISKALMRDYESSHYFPEQAEESLEERCLDGEQSAQLSATPTQPVYSSPDKMTEFSRLSRFGMTCELLTEDRGAELLTWFLEVSRVRTSALQAREQESKENAAGYGRTWRASFVKFNRDTSSWRTAQCSLVEGLDVFSETWPRWGWMRDGECYRQPEQEHRIGANVSGSSHMWPTPTTKSMCGGSHHLKMLQENTTAEESQQMGAGNGGALNPTWVEWLMGWPLGWTDYAPLEMDKFRQWRVMHGGF